MGGGLFQFKVGLRETAGEIQCWQGVGGSHHLAPLRRAHNGAGGFNHARVKRGQRWVRSLVGGGGDNCHSWMCKAEAGSAACSHTMPAACTRSLE